MDVIFNTKTKVAIILVLSVLLALFSELILGLLLIVTTIVYKFAIVALFFFLIKWLFKREIKIHIVKSKNKS